MRDAPPAPDRPIIFLDYDGTLAPIVDDPAAAVPHPRVPDLVTTLAQRHPVWAVSGRDLAALGRLLPARVNAIGLHGAEEGRLGGEIRNIALETHGDDIDRMRETVPDLPGVQVEEKSGAFAVHYRRADDPDAAREALRRWAATAPDALEPVFGKKVVELRPVGITKGTATAGIAREHPDRTPVYIGDDVTDEDAFRELAAIDSDAVTIKVGDGETEARFRLPDIEAVIAYLERLL